MWGRLAIFCPDQQMTIKSNFIKYKYKDCLSNEITFGRLPQLSVQIDHINCSKLHFILTKMGDMLLIKDCSLNGTLLNGNKIPKGQYVTIAHLDEIQVADCYCVFMDAGIMLNPPLVQDYYICQNNDLGKGTFATVKLA